jgi:hypothetical protein
MIGPGGGLAPSAWPLLLLPLAAFLVDATLTLGRRVLRGERWWEPHVQHAYQVWSRRLGRHAPVTLAYAAWSTLGAGAMAGMILGGSTFIIAMLAAFGWCLAGSLAWVALQMVSGDRKGQAQGQ